MSEHEIVDVKPIIEDASTSATKLLSGTVVNLETVPVASIFPCPIPIFTGSAFTSFIPPVAPADPEIPGLASITAPQFSGSSFFVPAPPAAPGDVSAPSVRDLTPPIFTGEAFSDPVFQGTIPGTVSFPASPDSPALATIAQDAVDPAPVLGAVTPVIIQPTPPADFIKAAPEIDTLQPVILPPEPDDTLPTSPNLEQITLPASPSIINPVFDAVLVGGPSDPTATFTYTQQAFADTLLTAVKSKLDFWLDDNSTGLSDAIFQNIWASAREREDGIAMAAREESFQEFAARGFSLPPGALIARNQEILQNNQNKSSSLSREQAIKQAEMEVENVRFAMTEASKLEVALVDNHLQIQRLDFEIARTTVDLALQLFASQVNRYNADVSAYRTRAEVFKTLLEGEVLKLDVFRAELDGERIKGEINTQKIDNYRAQIEAVLATFELFKSRLEASRFTIDSNKQLIDKFSARIEGYATEARAAAIATDIYSSRIDAEKLKIDTFGSEVDAYQAQVQGYSALVQAKATSKEQQISIERFKIEEFEANVVAVKAQIDALVAELNSETAIYDSQVRLFASEGETEARRFESDVGKFRTDTEAYSARIGRDVGAATIEVDTARINNERFGEEVRRFTAQVEGESRRFSGEVDKFGSEIQAFTAESQREVDTARVLVDQSNARATIYDANIRGFVGRTNAEAARFGAEVDRYAAAINLFDACNRFEVDKSRVSVDHLLGILRASSDAQVAGTRVAGQLGAAAMAQQNWSDTTTTMTMAGGTDNTSTQIMEGGTVNTNTQVMLGGLRNEIKTCKCYGSD